MIYTTLKTGDNEYRLRMTAKSIIDAETRLGKNPIAVLLEMSKNISDFNLNNLLVILHCALTPLNSGISMNDVYGIYDNYIDNGNTLEDLLSEITKVFEVSGFIKPETKENEKNLTGTSN